MNEMPTKLSDVRKSIEKANWFASLVGQALRLTQFWLRCFCSMDDALTSRAVMDSSRMS